MLSKRSTALKLSVIIVSYNVKHFVAQCLDTVQQAVSHIDAEVWVVDNNSHDGSVDMLRKDYPWVRLIALDENIGFSRGNNIAIQQSTGDYILILNPDTLVAGDTIERCINFLDAHPEAGATGTRMLGASGQFALESRRGLPTPFTSFCKMTGLNALFPTSRTFGKYYMRYHNEHEMAEIEVMSGAFTMIRRKALEQVGLFDERFFMYGEDIDLSYRLLSGGWKNYYIPAPIVHYKGESTQKSSFRYVHVFYNAMLIFYNKHFSKRYRLLTFIVKLAVLLRGAIDYLQQQMRRLTRALFPTHPLTAHFVAYCNDDDMERISNICNRNKLMLTRINDLSGPLPHDSVLVVSHNEMLSQFARGYDVEKLFEHIRKYKGELGIYNRKSDCLITTYKIF